jgi:NADH-quinone oxidoreductase E subunit
MLKFSEKNELQLTKLLAAYPNREAALLPALWMAQEDFGHISPEAMEFVANRLDLSPVFVESVATFYTMYNLKPVGRYHVQVCGNISCSLLGAAHIIEYLKRRLAIGVGETTADGRFTLREVECLASCGTAPVMMINETLYEQLTEEKIDKILEDLK